MNCISIIGKLFGSVDALQVGFSFMIDGRNSVISVPATVNKLADEIMQDVVSPVIDELEKNATRLDYYIKELEPYTQPLALYVSSKGNDESAVWDMDGWKNEWDEVLARKYGLSDKQVAQLAGRYCFIIDQRNEMAARLKSELERLKEWSEQDAEAARLKQETMRQERLKEQEPILSRLEQISSLMEANKPQDVKSAENETVGNYPDGLTELLFPREGIFFESVGRLHGRLNNSHTSKKTS